MNRRVVQNKDGWLVHILAKVINGGNQKFGIDVFLCLIGHSDVISAKDAEQVQLFVALWKDADLLAFQLPRSWQRGLHRKSGFVAKVEVDLLGNS